MAACTERGFATMGRAAEALAGAFPQSRILQTGRCADVPGFEDGPKLSDLAKEWFYRADALIFFTAAGIAVRCIAPYVEDKFRDPAVLSVDESGRFVIPLLSGHAGGANRIGQILAKALGAQAVITTATDGRGLFAVDTFAAENGLQLSDRTRAKEVSARLLAGKPIRIFREEGILPIFDFPENSDGAFSSAEKTDHTSVSTENAGVWETACRADADVIISCRRKKGDRADALYLIPPAVTLGIGCRRGAPAGNIQSAAEQALEEAGVFRQALRGIASIDLKKEEPGLLAFAEQWELPLTFFTAQELNAVPGAFSDSAFVREVAGVDCVCERGAVCLAGPGGRLLTHKQSFDGVTAALALAASGRMWPYA